MSTHDDGYGRPAGPSSGSQSDFTHRKNLGGAPGAETWGNNALNPQTSEVNLMAHGGGRPAHPATGPRPMFGGGSPVFAQMPVYTPVTRGPATAPQTLDPPQSPYGAYAQPAQPSPMPPSQQAGGFSYPANPASPPYPSPGAAPNYQSPYPHAAPGYQGAQPHYLDVQNFQAAPAPQPQPAEFPPQVYQPAQTPNFGGGRAPQAFPGTGYGGGQAQPYQGQPFADASFPERGAGDASFPETSYDQNFPGANFGNQDFAKQNFGDASFPEPQSFDASFPETNFSAAPAYGHQEQQGSDGMSGYAQPQGQNFETFAEELPQDYGMMSGEVPPSDPRRQLQAFDALYDQPPQISLGTQDQTRRAAQDFFESERVDADFLDETQAIPPPVARGKMTFKGRSAFMVGSALLGAIALGGALAFAYKQSGGGLSGEQPPLVTADNRPVKELPDDPGGKDFPHKNKLIYDRLTNGDEPEAERIVSRQENVAVPALPSAETAGMPAPVASTDLATQSVGGEPMAVASVGDSTMPDGGPRKVKTMVVRPDGSFMESEVPQVAEVPALPEAAAQQPASMPAPEPPQQVAAVEAPPAPAPKPAAKPAQQQTAAAAPQAAAAPTKYVVQVASKKNQTEALASFADMQQKYPSLLASYKPIVQKADLGEKGVWYRLRIGPITDKTAASKLCTQLKQQGLPDCLVMAAQ
jgi:cell division septation protein DedD